MTPEELATKLDRARRALDIERILARHGARIETKAAPLTPVDKGFLRRANQFHTQRGAGTVTLTVENRMVYAHYQHENVLKHRQPQARDHFLSIPFEQELPAIMAELRTTFMEALQ